MSDNLYGAAVFPPGSVYFDSSESLVGISDAFRAIKGKKVKDRDERMAYRNKMCNAGDQYSCGVVYAFNFIGSLKQRKQKASAVLDATTPARAAEMIRKK